MNRSRLTGPTAPAMSAFMAWRGGVAGRTGGGNTIAMVMVMAGAMTLGGCISVNAPDKPIVIELNINIKQEVIYRLAADAGNTIDDNPEIF